MKLFEYIGMAISIAGVFYKLVCIEKSLSDSVDEIKIKLAIFQTQQEERQEYSSYFLNQIEEKVYEKINQKLNKLTSELRELKNKILKE